jgi:hypothetical protein
LPPVRQERSTGPQKTARDHRVCKPRVNRHPHKRCAGDPSHRNRILRFQNK